MDDLLDEVKESDVRALLASFKELNLADHYDFSVEMTSTMKDSESVAFFLKNNRPLIFEISESNTLYYKTDAGAESKVFDVDVETSFVKSDDWLYSKLIPVSNVFPSVMKGEISNEMTGFYTCLVIASVFGDEFEVELIEVSDLYNFKDWCPVVDGEVSFTELLTSWVQLGSKYVKLVAAAAKYALVREKQKKRVPSALQLPQEVVLELNKTIKDVSQIRYEFDEIKLSSFNKSKLSKLEVKVIIAERDLKIQKRIEVNSQIYQVWRLINLNSNVIPPNVLLKINRNSKSFALEFFQKLRGSDSIPSTRDEKVAVKQLENKLKKVVRRAYLNKLFASESAKFVSNPSTYIAPNFV